MSCTARRTFLSASKLNTSFQQSFRHHGRCSGDDLTSCWDYIELLRIVMASWETLSRGIPHGKWLIIIESTSILDEIWRRQKFLELVSHVNEGGHAKTLQVFERHAWEDMNALEKSRMHTAGFSFRWYGLTFKLFWSWSLLLEMMQKTPIGLSLPYLWWKANDLTHLGQYAMQN